VFYGGERWARVRAAKLAATPLCEYCPADRRRAASCVDHRVPVAGEDDPGAWAWDNLVSACWACHSAKTARGSEAGAVRTTKPMKGCDAAGRPLDPTHPWARQEKPS
jgi:5-methylcytosine-specific restriction protein A